MNINRLSLDQRVQVLNSMINLPVKVIHAEYSLLMSAHDDCSRPSEYLLDVALGAIRETRKISMPEISARIKTPPYLTEVWPGEHYKLLAGLMVYLRPQSVVEIGTATGLSALTMKEFLPSEAKLVTFDIARWETFAATVLRKEDFTDGRLVQIIDDLSVPAVMEKHADLLRNADFIFLDAPKDGKFEPRFLTMLAKIPFTKPPLLLFDDIHLWNMLAVWRNIRAPKIDLTSFGHWSGTGLVQLALP